MNLNELSMANALPAGLQAGWHAALELGYALVQGRTVPVHRRHQGPLRVQKHFIDAHGQCQHIVVHPPGGMAGGDRLTLDIDLAAGSQVLLTSPGAAKWYDSFGRQAGQQLQVRQQPGSLLEWLPQETILYAGSTVQLDNCFRLQGDARLLAGEVMCLGRPASAEHFDRGLWQQASEVWRDDTLLWCEHNHVPGDSPLLASPVGMGGHTVLATLLWAGPALPPDIHQACLELPCAGRAAASQLPGIWLARFIGDSAEAAHHWLRGCRNLIYPFSHGRAASQPRIWAS